MELVSTVILVIEGVLLDVGDRISSPTSMTVPTSVTDYRCWLHLLNVGVRR